jgi:hypothetical protein
VARVIDIDIVIMERALEALVGDMDTIGGDIGVDYWKIMLGGI